MTDWREHLTPKEAKRLAEIEDKRRNLTTERQTLHNRAKQRKHRKEQGNG
jgi:hypothetical protein